MTRIQRWTAWLRAALTPRRTPTLIHFYRGGGEGGPLCYSRGRRPRKGSGWTTDPRAVTCRRCRKAMTAASAPVGNAQCRCDWRNGDRCEVCYSGRTEVTP